MLGLTLDAVLPLPAMFQVLTHAQVKLAPGTWQADHAMGDYWPDTSMLAGGNHTCTKARAKLGWCHITVEGDGTGMPAGQNLIM